MRSPQEQLTPASLAQVRSTGHSTTRQPPERRMGISLQQKFTPPLFASLTNSPPLFAFARLGGLIRYRHVSAFGVHFLLRNSPITLLCPARRAVHHPPVPCASHPPVLCTCGLRVPLGHFGSSLRSDLLRSAGEGVRRKALKISDLIIRAFLCDNLSYKESLIKENIRVNFNENLRYLYTYE